MRFVPTTIHAASDYVLGLALLALPWIWAEESPIGAWIPMAVGALILVQAAMTEWELSVAKVVPVPVHLMMDAVVGVTLAVSPFMFDFWQQIWIPHVLIGVLMVAAAAFTRTGQSQRDTRTANAPSKWL